MTKLSVHTIQKKLSEAANSKSPLPAGSKMPSMMGVPKNKSKNGDSAENKPSFGRDKARPAGSNKSTGPKGSGKVAKSSNSGPEKPNTAYGTAKETKYGKSQGTKTSTVKSPAAPPAGKTKSPMGSYSPFGGKDPSPVNKSSPKPPSVGTMDEIKGSILPGLDPKKFKKIDLKLKQTDTGGIIVPTWNAVKHPETDPGTKNPNTPYGQKKVSESVVDGTVTVLVNGRPKSRFEAANGRVVSKIVESYVDLGRKVSIEFRPGVRSCYSDRAFHRTMMEASHLNFHGITGMRNTLLNKAMKMLAESLSGEFNELYSSKKEWVLEALAPTIKQIAKKYDEAYKSSLRDYEVQIRTESKNGVQDVLVNTVAINEQSAAHTASEEIISEDGLDNRIKQIFVDGKKVLPENAEKGIFSVSPKYFDDMPGPIGKLAPKKSNGETAENKPDAPKTVKLGNPSAKSRVGDRDVPVQKAKMPGGKGGDFSSKVTKDPKAPASGSVFKPKFTQADSGPIYESSDVLTYLKGAVKKLRGKPAGRILEGFLKKIQSDIELSEAEANILDKMIEISISR